MSDVTAAHSNLMTPAFLMNATTFELRPIGRVESPLTALEAAPRQADEGAPSASLVFDEHVRDGIANLRPGDQLILLTWLDRAQRDVLVVHPRGDTSRPREGSSAHAPLIVPTRSGCTACRWSPSRDCGCRSTISRR